jgi:hypothetical protein
MNEKLYIKMDTSCALIALPSFTKVVKNIEYTMGVPIHGDAYSLMLTYTDQFMYVKDDLFTDGKWFSTPDGNVKFNFDKCGNCTSYIRYIYKTDVIDGVMIDKSIHMTMQQVGSHILVTNRIWYPTDVRKHDSCELIYTYSINQHRVIYLRLSGTMNTSAVYFNPDGSRVSSANSSHSGERERCIINALPEILKRPENSFECIREFIKSAFRNIISMRQSMGFKMIRNTMMC